MKRLLGGVRAVLGRAERTLGYQATHRLAATLAYHWARDAEPSSAIGVFVETGELSEATVDELYEELVALDLMAPAGSTARREEEWTPRAVARALLEYAAVHRPRGPVPGWKALRDERPADIRSRWGT